jgi:tellurite resistance protein TerC
MTELVPFVIFNLVVIVLLGFDLLVCHRNSHEIKMKEALYWSAFWVFLSLLFAVFIYFWRGPTSTMEYLAGYLVEKSLSADNVFVFILIFSYFQIPKLYQHKVLFWGVVGALVMRAIFIFAGISLVAKFHWLLYILGAFLVYLGIKIIFKQETEIHPEKNPVFRIAKKFIPLTDNYEGGNFFIKRNGVYLATPLFIALLVVETTDIVFAIDSIPAVMAITLDPFIIYSSNVFAILGLRALYFALAGLMPLFKYLHYGIGLILAFVGLKMLASAFYKIPVGVSLVVIGVILVLSLLLSLIGPQKNGEKP